MSALRTPMAIHLAANAHVTVHGLDGIFVSEVELEAIEAQAARDRQGLDVGRLAAAMVRCQVDVAGMGRFSAVDVARDVLAEYARLATPEETP